MRMTLGAGQVVSMLTFYSKNMSFYTAGVYNFCISYLTDAYLGRLIEPFFILIIPFLIFRHTPSGISLNYLEAL